jgi:hypothetical protein
MKKAKFAPVTAALLAREGEVRPWGGNAHAEAAPESVDLLSGSLQRIAKDAANKKSAVPPFTIAARPTGPGNLTPQLSQSDYEGIGRLIAAKLTRQRDSLDDRPHFGSGGTKTESAQLIPKWVWLKLVLSGFQALGHGPRL